ncbi:hydroxymethylbilane synthase [Desulforhabdus sp. TSK]|uniref:hydroxymethylbilane synthase n=1 Tax=Desulforhabdus sp. TSK TaxID=2925014 RepID=UPI001FC8A52B|nr:hydroxymethylbilane synthase [Desulforhabdus sp. TSK]GKT08467.1 porphobilinogen deaminase [Desulforhabdus sp. TSK]
MEENEDALTNRTLRIGTRGSLLALKQSTMVKETLESLWPGLRVELHIIKTTGDKILDVPLAKVGGKGLFVKEIEDALLAEEVDLAVHSIKDVPALLPPGLEIGAIPRREDPRDVLITRSGEGLEALPPGARVGTSSLRRSAQLKTLRPDFDIQNLRGNLDTRLRKLHEGMYDAILLAAAGIHRMGWEDKISHYLDRDAFIPAIGQGAIGIELRSADVEVRQILAPVHDADTAVAVEAERSLLRELEGGCQVPIGGHALVQGDHVTLTGLVASLDGRRVFRVTRSAERQEAEVLGREVARALLDRGARQVLAEIYSDGASS